jgi:hypothetical protein
VSRPVLNVLAEWLLFALPPSHRNQTTRRGGLAKRRLCAANPTIAKPMSAIAQVDGSGTDARIVSVTVAEPARLSWKPVSSI